MDSIVRQYLSEIGRKGGRKSRRVLTPSMARRMTRVREAKRAYRKFYSLCFWSYDPNLKIGEKDIDWVGKQLKKYGNRTAWEIAARLCR